MEHPAVLCAGLEPTIIGGSRTDAFEKTIAHLMKGLGRQYSCVSVAAGRGDEVYFAFCAGNRRDYDGDVLYHPDPQPVNPDTLYDMASVTKLISTTMVALRLMEEGEFSLYDSLWRFIDAGSFRNAEIRHLMTHTSGVTPHIPLYRVCSSPDETLAAIAGSVPVCGLGEDVNYSCMGYILLQKVLERIAGRGLDELAREYVFEPLGMKTACYRPESDNVASTEYSPHENRYVRGHVHDENAHFLGGVSGNAGVFCSLGDVISFASMLSCRGVSKGKVYLGSHTFETAVRNHTQGLSEARGLGFALHGGMLSASGELMSPDSYGHNGYTGTSVYVDGRTGIYAVLLTNSVHYGRDNRAPFFRARRISHNILLAETDRL